MSQICKKNIPSALKEKDEIIHRLREGRPAIFLDYDGTLTPIVEDPSRAVLPENIKELISELSEHWLVAIISGRAMADVKRLVGIENIIYAGSHGLNIYGPEESFHETPGERFSATLDRVEKDLEDTVKDLDGVRVERKPYAIAVHYRQAGGEVLPELEKRLSKISDNYPNISKQKGKKIFEFRPDIEWNKGKAIEYLMERLFVDSSRVVPVYIGDDTTDEDGFKSISNTGIGILVGDHKRQTEAHYTLRDPAETEDFLQELVKLAREGSSFNIWSLTYEGFDTEQEKLREALCTVGNGYFAARGAAPESTAGSVHYPGTYMAGIYNRLKSQVEGRKIENESLVNVPNWLAFDFCIGDDDWFKLGSVNIFDYHQELDMLHGVLTRSMLIEDKKKRRTRIIQRRFAHMTESHLAGLETRILAMNWSGSIRIRSGLDGRVENTLVERYRGLNNHHLEQLGNGAEDDIIWIQADTSQSHIRIAEAARTELFSPDGMIDLPGRIIMEPGYIAREFDVKIETGREIRIEKIAALYNSRDSAISESLIEAQDLARHAEKFGKLLESHILAWAHLWDRWQIKVQTESPRISQILNLHIFHLLQTVSPNSAELDVGVPPRGLHGEAYRGLIMWDELFIFPLLNLRMPDITRSLLKYRYHRLPRARQAAKISGYKGAMFPWQSGSNGQEQAQTLHLNPQSGNWIPDNTQLERHINIAIGYNIWQYYQVTGDEDFMYFYGTEMLIQIVRFWASKAKYNHKMGRYEICGIMGPDEFHEKYPESSEPGIDNNAYTNVMLAWLLWRTLEIIETLPERRRRSIMEDFSIKQNELDQWEDIGRKLRVPFHDGGIISQFEGYGDLQEFNWEEYKKKYGNIQRLDRILESEGDSPDRYKVSKQADVLMLFYLLSADELNELFDRLGYTFTKDTIPDNIDYYLERTSNGSTLSRVVHAWVLSRSEREMSWTLFQDALESDIEDIQGGTTREGIHLGAMAGTVDIILRCYSGIESRGSVMWFNPRLPAGLKSLRFSIKYCNNYIDVDITGRSLKLHNHPGPANPVKIGFKGRTYQIAPGDDMEFEL
jgi:alpha,alpha-trehalase